MVTISLDLPDELARRLRPFTNRLPEIIELGLQQLESKVPQSNTDHVIRKDKVLAALATTGIVTLPQGSPTYSRQTPIKAGGPPASEMVIKERRREL